MTREEFLHDPVMLGEVVEALAATPQGVLLDATVGGGGHAAALLEASARHRLVGIDRDPDAVEAATRRLSPYGARATIVRARFDRLSGVLEEVAPDEPLVGALFDLGVSSPQFDSGARGFSYRFDGPLDMRMDPGEGTSAADLVNSLSEEELARLFADHGESRFSRVIARAVVAARPLETTAQLADVVRTALPAAARHGGGHPAKRVFQALRIAVNGELELLPHALEAAMERLSPGGRIAVLSYHSGEDRIVKARFAAAAAGWCRCPAHLPCVCGAVPVLRLLNRGARLPTAAEIARNPRAASARLRVGERLEGPWRPTREEK